MLECSVALGAAVAGDDRMVLYALGLAALGLAYIAWRSLRARTGTL